MPMNIYRPSSLESLSDFAGRSEQFAIFEREEPPAPSTFFAELTKEPFVILAKVHKNSALREIRALVEKRVPKEMQNDQFYLQWTEDMAKVSQFFCAVLGADAVCFWLGSKRGCTRYHVDSVPFRLVVTYHSQGTEWLEDDNVNREAFLKDENNAAIVKDPAAAQFMNRWDVALFRGNDFEKGVLHRTPDAAFDHPSILMKLDEPAFYDRITED